ncbi:ribosomal biosynthesis protein [Archaeoglobales archaeon ex4484_92]|nr:MAG: ribosomal biosynthesis protein [Archaeoglobales archaeon ex4484_92]
MILTTSRKPSRKTRTLAKVLAKFFNWDYVSRGKKNLNEFMELDEFCLLSEIKGNPALLHFYKKGEKILEIGFKTSNIKKVKLDGTPPVFIGEAPFDPLVFGAVPQNKAGLKFMRKVDLTKKVVVKGNTLFFTYRELTLFHWKLSKVVSYMT